MCGPRLVGLWRLQGWVLLHHPWEYPTGHLMGHLRNDAEGGFPLIFPLPRDLLLVCFWMWKKKSGRKILLNLPGYEECAASVVAWTS